MRLAKAMACRFGVPAACESVEARRYAQSDAVYPIVRMHKYRVASRIDGVASGRSTEVSYALVLRAGLLSVGKTSGPFRDCISISSMRALATLRGCIIGSPLLDSTPYGWPIRLIKPFTVSRS